MGGGIAADERAAGRWHTGKLIHSNATTPPVGWNHED
jgi:hypothetical protein